MSGLHLRKFLERPATPPRSLEDIGNELFTNDDIHDMFMSMVNAKIDHVLSDAAAAGDNSKFTKDDQDDLARLVQGQMKRAVETRKRAIRQQRRSHVYILLTRESLETYRQINSAVVTISALGAGFTFSVIFSEVSETYTGASKEHVTSSLAAAWLLFVVAILLASYATAYQTMRESAVINSLFMLRILHGSLVLGAFVASAEAVRAYQPAVGITAFAVFGVVGIVGLYASLRAKHVARRVLRETEC